MISSKFKKTIAVFFLLLFVQSLVAPVVSYALTAGPTAPEATSFEPFDVTDLVDLKTGDFTYGLPLLEVPGPAGGYPISLSYHAGILADVEASWVGLGFTLNPGAITRLVNGYPDDHNYANNVTREFWAGGKTETKTVGLSYGLANMMSVSADLTFANDTYKGRGVGWSAGGSLGYERSFGGVNYRLGLGMESGVSPYGERYAQADFGARFSAYGGNIGVGATLNSSGKIEAGFSGGDGLLQTSISSNGNATLTVAGGRAQFIHRQNASNVNEILRNWKVEIPIYQTLSLRLGRSYHRWWIDQTDNAIAYGSLYATRANPSLNVAFDTYDVVDTRLDLVDHNNPEKTLGGSFPDVDSYVVTAQGLVGSMQPSIFKQDLYSQNKKDKDNVALASTYPLMPRVQQSVHFNFVNDFSNRYEFQPGNLEIHNGNTTTPSMSFSLDGTTTTGKTGSDGIHQNHLAGSKHIEWYSNRDIVGSNPGIIPKEEGFIDVVAEGFTRDNNDQIGGYSITNSTGVTYHYALPAYSFGEEIKSQNTTKQQQESGLYYTHIKKPEKYAHTWHLTAVTGADFIDTNNNGIADKGDGGYWVRFEYKKWIGDYAWRNPGEGLHKDLDANFEFYSAGKKELYALKAIVTESHAASFMLSSRNDGRESISVPAGGHGPVQHANFDPDRQACLDACQQDANCVVLCNEQHPPIGTVAVARPTFKLDEIRLFKADDYLTNNMVPVNVLRAIKFDYDYSLAVGTPNSYDSSDPCLQLGSAGPCAKLGRLTLKSLHFQGKKKIELIPPINFVYAKNPEYKKDFSDMWGYYKSDYVDRKNKNLSKLTTPVSAVDVDAWSLTSIITSLGSEIQIRYESDEYKKPELYLNNILSVDELQANTSDESISVTISPSPANLNEIEDVLKKSKIELLLRRSFFANEACKCENIVFPILSFMGDYYSTKTVELTLENIVQITPTTIKFTNSELYSYLTTTDLHETYVETPCQELEYNSDFDPETRLSVGLFVAGNIVMKGNTDSFGGGLRVKELSMKNGEQISATSYTYRNGVTPFEPVNFGKIDFNLTIEKENPEWKPQTKRVDEAKKGYKKKIYHNFSNIIAAAQNIPGPGVMYGEVEVRQSYKGTDNITNDFPNYTVYKFETFNDGLVDFIYSDVSNFDVQPQNDPDADSPPNFVKIKNRTSVLKDYTARVGNLKSIGTFDLNNQPITLTENFYLHDNIEPTLEANISQYEPKIESLVSNQGVIEQAYSRARIVRYDKDSAIPYPLSSDPERFVQNERHLLAVISKRETFPSIQTGQRIKNFKTGVVSTTENLAFDFYSGEPVKVVSSDSYGNRFLTSATPAYEKYPEMGLRTELKSNKHMLTQSAGEVTYLANAQNQPQSIVSASIQTWSSQVPSINVSNTHPVWLKHSAFLWNAPTVNPDGSGTFLLGDFSSSPFNWSTNTGANWEKINEVTLTDRYTHALEGTDINGKFAATRMDNKDQRTIATASNSQYSEFAFSGAEYYAGNSNAEGGVLQGQGEPSIDAAHSGHSSLMISPGQKGFQFALNNPNRKSKASVWVYAPGAAETQGELNKVLLYYQINGGAPVTVHPIIQKTKSKSWYLLSIVIPAAENAQVEIGVKNNAVRAVYFDDFRVHPLDASMVSYVYDQKTGELTHVLDGNNFYTKYEYDAMGRVVRTKKELLNYDFGDGKESVRPDLILSENVYNYGGN